MVTSTATSPLFSGPWWRDVLARAGRQAAQVVIPVLALATAGNLVGVDPLGVALGMALAVALTVLKAVLGLSVDPRAPLVQQAAERAASAAAGALLAVLPVDGRALLDLDWGIVGTAVAGAVGLALVAMFTNTPQPVEASSGERRLYPTT